MGWGFGYARVLVMCGVWVSPHKQQLGNLPTRGQRCAAKGLGHWLHTCRFKQHKILVMCGVWVSPHKQQLGNLPTRGQRCGGQDVDERRDAPCCCDAVLRGDREGREEGGHGEVIRRT